MSCIDLNIIQSLEYDLGKPVVSSNQATMWMTLKEVDVGEPMARLRDATFMS